MSRIYLLLIASTLSFSACMKPAIQPDQGPAAEAALAAAIADSLARLSPEEVIQVETFDPFSLPMEDLFYEPAQAEMLVADEYDSESQAEEMGGFQVQLIATPHAELAEDMSMQAKMLFPTELVTLVFDPPNYKVRIGTPSSRELAEELKRQALRLGYSEAWVVRRKAD